MNTKESSAVVGSCVHLSAAAIDLQESWRSIVIADCSDRFAACECVVEDDVPELLWQTFEAGSKLSGAIHGRLRVC